VVNENKAVEATAPNSLSGLTQLHLVGVILAAFAQLPLLGDGKTNGWTVQPLLEYLQSSLRLKEGEEIETERSSIWQLYQKAQEQEQDCNLEWAVVRQQNIKKEPARAIARRLRQQQQQQQLVATTTTNSETQDEAMEEKKGAQLENRTDYMQEWQSMLDNWRRKHGLGNDGQSHK
jgi:hypothetical protein